MEISHSNSNRCKWKPKLHPTTVPYADTQAPFAPTVTVMKQIMMGKPTASGVAEPGSKVTLNLVPDGTTSTVTADQTTEHMK